MGNPEVVWKDPPPDRRYGGRKREYETRLRAVMEQPGRWALLATFDNKNGGRNLAGNLNRNVWRPPGRWEFTSRMTDDGGSETYARYLGGDDE